MATEPSMTPGPARKDDIADVGWTHYVQGEYPEAEAAFRRALDEDPDSIEANYGMGLLLKAKGEPHQASRLFEKVIERVNAGALGENRARATMLRHLSETHLRDISPQEWQAPAE